MAFVAAEYWDIAGTFFSSGRVRARVVAVDARRVAQGRDFARDGRLTDPHAVQLDERAARSLAEELAARRSPVRWSSGAVVHAPERPRS